MFKRKVIPMKSNISFFKLATKWISDSLVLFLVVSWSVITNAQEFSVVSSGISSKLDYYSSPYTFYLVDQHQVMINPNDIVGMGIAGSNDHVYVWYKDGTVSSGSSSNLTKYRNPYKFTLPPKGSVVAMEGITQPVYTPQDIVGMGIAGSNDHVYVWYADGFVSAGNSSNLAAYRKPYRYVLPDGKKPDDIVGMGIAGSDDHVYVWYKDGTVSAGNSWDLAAYRKPYNYSLPPGASYKNIVGMGITGADGPKGPRPDDHVYVWYRAKGARTGDLAAVDWCYRYEPKTPGREILITFYPRIKNLGPLGWASSKEGKYIVGGHVAAVGSNVEGKLRSYPFWSIGPGETMTLETGYTESFHIDNTYKLLDWYFIHPDDTNPKNNRSPAYEIVKGSRFATGGDMAHKICPSFP